MEITDKAFLTKLLGTPSPSGFEQAGQRVWAGYIRECADHVENDTYGNTWGVLEGSGGKEGHRLMLEAHADEIGFMVNHITDEGYLHIVRIGGSDPAVLRGRRVRVLGDEGVVHGVIGITAIHIRESKENKNPKWEDVFIDIGAKDKDEVAARGIRVGHPAVFDEDLDDRIPGRLVGRALDNRIGGYIIARVLKSLSEDSNRPDATVMAVNAIQEEIGGNGARMVTYRLQPTVAVVLDVTHATDSPGISKPKHGAVKLGGGPALTHGTANHPLVVQRIMEVAESLGIPIQHEASSRFTGTDTDDVFVSRSGVPSALVSLPMRYMHSTVEMVSIEDVEAVIKLLVGVAKSVKGGDSFVPKLL